jgi:hypothetical protein
MQYLKKLQMTALLTLATILTTNSATAAGLVAANKSLNRLHMNSLPPT